VSESILRTEGVTKVYVQGDSALEVLKGVTLDVRKGEILAIVGPSGAGKSTLLHIMGFLDRPTEGDVAFREIRLSKLGQDAQAAVRNRHFGFVFQLYHLLPELSALENTLIPMMIRHSVADWMVSGAAARARARSILQRLGLGARLHHLPSELSGGEQQRLAIARAIVGEPDVVYCDEPTGSLDSRTGEEIRNLIVELNRETGKTFVIVTHDEDTAKLAHRRLRLEDGRLVGQGG